MPQKYGKKGASRNTGEIRTAVRNTKFKIRKKVRILADT